MDWVGEVPIETVRRLACDCTVWRALLDPLSGMPLDVGRERRVAPEWMLRALHARDRGCRWPGCDAPSNWTDAHHWREWYRDGGETNVDDMVSACRPHHVMVHEGGGAWPSTRDRRGHCHPTRRHTLRTRQHPSLDRRHQPPRGLTGLVRRTVQPSATRHR